MVEAAGELFLAQGYGSTSLDDIAARAGVSTPTVYAKFGSKAGLLKVLVDVSVAGDDEDVPLLERADLQAHQAIESLPERVRAMCEAAHVVHGRSAPVLRLVARVSGSDPAVAELHAELERQMRETALDNLGTYPASVLRDGMDRDRAADVILTLGHPEVWSRLVHDAGWTGEQYVDWLEQAITSTVLDLGAAG